jgi:uncharacterized membrane protein
MAPITVIYSLLMIALGFGTYWVTEGDKGLTPLIPAFFGAVFLFLGLLGLKDNLRKHAMHAAAALALIAFLAPVIRLAVSGVKSSLAATEQGIMAALSAGFVGLCVRSFIEARRARARREAVG